MAILGFLTLGSAYTVAGPPFESPDEISHAEYVTFLSDHRHLPVLHRDCVRLSFHPPLYHVLLVPLALLTGTSTEDVLVGQKLNPEYPSSKIILVHGYPDEAVPYDGAVRFVKLARLLTLLMALPVLVYTHRIARLVLDDGSAATLAVVTVASVPQFQYLAASVNHDAFAAACGAALLYYSVRLAQAPSVAPALGAGISLGVGLLTKSSLLTLAPIPIAALLCHGRTHSVWQLIWRGILVLSVGIGLAGWWYIYTFIHYGYLLPAVALHQTTWVGDHLVRTSPMDFASFLAALSQIFQSFWFLAGLMNIPAAPWMYAGWVAVSMLVLMGFGLMLLRCDTGILTFGFCLCLAGVIHYCFYVYSSQGRYLFIVLPAVGIAVGRSLTLLPLARRAHGALVVILIVTILSVTCFWRSFAPVYAAITPHTRELVVETAQLYYGNEYQQVMHARGGELHGLTFTGRRLGEGADDVQMRITVRNRRAESREVAVSAEMLSDQLRSVRVQIQPISMGPGEEYYVSLRAPQATPTARPAFVCRRAPDTGGLSLNGIALHGSIEITEIVQ